MFSLEPQDVVAVRLSGAMDSDPVALPVMKIEAKTFFCAVKSNKAFCSILKKGVDEAYAKKWGSMLAFTDVIENMKKLKDEEYASRLARGPSKRSRKFKSFVLQLPEIATISAPPVGDNTSIEMRVRLSS
jgi:hypothetical protein